MEQNESSKRRPGRPKGTHATRGVALQVTITPDLNTRLESHSKSSTHRRELVEEALTLLLDIRDGKRTLPPREDD